MFFNPRNILPCIHYLAKNEWLSRWHPFHWWPWHPPTTRRNLHRCHNFLLAFCQAEGAPAATGLWWTIAHKHFGPRLCPTYHPGKWAKLNWSGGLAPMLGRMRIPCNEPTWWWTRVAQRHTAFSLFHSRKGWLCWPVANQGYWWSRDDQDMLLYIGKQPSIATLSTYHRRSFSILDLVRYTSFLLLSSLELCYS